MNKIDLDGIDNIIFDLGMVIINLEMEATSNAFKEIFQSDYEAVMNQLKSEDHFEQYETGKITTKVFIDKIASFTQKHSKSSIANAWNAMLRDIPDHRFNTLLRAKEKYRTFCLSNTNELHIEFIYDYLKKEKKIDDLSNYFEKVYLSHEIGMRKPNREIFEFVLNENAINAERTLFIDDTLEHIQGAEMCGIKTLHLSKGLLLEDVIDL